MSSSTPGQNLTREEAATRADLLTVHSYDVVLDLATGPTTFATRSTVRFDASRRVPRRSSTSWASRSSRSPSTAPPSTRRPSWIDSRIALPGLAAENELVVEATALYTNTGEGMHRFVDPVDGEVYLYSQFEVADSRRVFAVFEQPDLKATFAFTVTAPAHWTVRSVSPTPEPTPAGDRDGTALATWAFAPTPVLSSYVTALVSGPYVGVTDTVQSRRGPGRARGVRASLALRVRRLRQHHRPDQDRLRVLRARVRLGLPVREVRPDLHAGVQRRRHGERRLRDHHRDLRLPRQGRRSHWSSAGG